MIPASKRGLVSFGTFEVDVDTGEIRKAGMRVRLAGQPFRILAMLLSHPGEIVTREELQREVWGANTNVDFERGLASAVNKIREALGDSADHPVYIETLARRGYRFIAPLSAQSPTLRTGGSAELPLAPGSTILEAIPTAELVQLPETIAPVAVQREPEGRRGSILANGPIVWAKDRALPLVLFLLLVAAAGVIARYAMRPNGYLRPPLIDQLTEDGSIYTGPPNPETLLVLATDGPRIYVPTLSQGRSQISALDLSGNEIQPLSMPDDLSSIAITDISHDGSRLLVRSLNSREPEQALWVEPTTGSGAQRVGEVLAHDAVFMPGDTNRILYAAGNELDTVRLDTGVTTPFAQLPGRAFWPRWSPDGRSLRFTVLDPLTHKASLWELSTASHQAHRLEFPELQNRSVCCGSWTPAGDLYVFQVADAMGSNIWAQTSDSHPELLQLTNGPLRFSSPLPSRENRTVYAVGAVAPASTRVYDPARHEFVPAPRFLAQAQRVSYSRDGAWVAWTDTEARLWRARAGDGSDLLRLTGDDLEVYLARWSPDGQQLLLMARGPGETWQIYTVNAGGGALHRVFSDGRNVADPDWGPNGQRVVFGREADLMGKENGLHKLQILNLRTQTLTEIPGSEDLFSPRWSPDGRYLAALSRDQARLLLFSFSTGTWKILFTKGAADPVWSADSQSLYFHAFAEADSAILRVSLDGRIDPIADLAALGLPSVDNFFFSGVTPSGLPLVKPRIGTGNLYSISLPVAH